MGLDERGVIAAVQMATYGPLLCLTPYLTWKEPDRRMGWHALTMMAVLRLIGGITRILSASDQTNVAKRTAYGVAEGAGQGPLLIATIGFLRTVSQHAVDRTFFFTKRIMIFGVVGITGVVLAIAGAVKGAVATTMDAYNYALELRRAGMILFLILFTGMLLTAALCWLNWSRLLKYRRKLLVAVTVTIPFLLVRVLYGSFGTWGPVTMPIWNGRQIPLRPSNDCLGRGSPISSQWGIYLVKSVLTEYIVVAIYLLSGLLIPLKKEMVVYEQSGINKDSISEKINKERVTVGGV
ncbi:hypothetical protein C8Q76DRAFT_286066 [Earliella scabrosa]|nr:hypothetical protein C8Q76DRAFT_286066 [Earliella scabrosa]